MLGTIIGDIAGLPYERSPATGKFTIMDPEVITTFSDDTILTMAIAHFCQNNTLTKDNLSELAIVIKDFAKRYPSDGYGKGFRNWVASESLESYGSWANGSAMRVSYIGYSSKSIAECLELSKLTAMVTHDTPEGIKGAQAIAVAIFLAKTEDKETIRDIIQAMFEYDLNRTILEIKDKYTFDVSCEGSVPEAIIAFLDSSDFESAIYNAISLGGDSDTQAAMAGGIAESFYKNIPVAYLDSVYSLIPEEFIDILKKY